MAAPPKPKSAIPVIGGVLMLLVGVIGLVEGLIVILFAVGVFGSLMGLIPIDIVGMGGIVETLLIIVGLIPVILGVFAILGGVSAIGRKSFGLAVFGGICAMFILGPIFIPNILGFISLILVAVAHEEFK